MNNNTTSQYMDKQIMDLSNSQSPISTHDNNSGSNNNFIDFMNRPAEKKDDIASSYDFMPIRPTLGSSSPTADRSLNLDSGVEDAPLRTWNSVDSRINASPVRNYSSPDADEPAKFTLGRNHKSSDVPLDASLVSEIDRTMKKHMDNLMHAVDKISARLSQLETRTRNIEGSIDDLKAIVENNHGTTDGKMRLLENVLTEVHTGVQFIRDKQEIIEAQLQIAKLHQVPKTEQVETKNTANPCPTQTGVSTHQQFTQNIQPNAPPQPLPQQNIQPHVQQHPNQFPQNQIPHIPQQESSYFPPPNQVPKTEQVETKNTANPGPTQTDVSTHQQFTQHVQHNAQLLPQQNIKPHVQQHPNPFPQNQLPRIPQQESSYFPPPSQNPENPSQQYQIPLPPPQQQQPAPPSQLQHQYTSTPQPQYSQPPPPSQPQFSPVHPPVGHHPEETPYVQSQTYSLGIRPPSGIPPPPQYYGPNPNNYEPPSNRIGSGPGFSGSFGEPYPYSSSPEKSQHSSSSGIGQSGYPQLPTARILPQSQTLPTASAVGGGSGSESGNRVPIDDVVDRVTNMGFPREQVRATVRKLTENGQAVDLNIVLDKLMNDGDGQGLRGGWPFAR
ncbi:hypothetical protein CASFOL_026415 [Castilleja foliolosa]|uniref:DUF1421 domain-containing protein n=1 Tax=Castilleja foliolosa TaxID=1961234 RepID=A0ABD3CHV4_9LAMI